MTPDGWERRKIREFSERLKRINLDGHDLEPLSVTKDRGVVLQSEKYNKRIATDSRKYVIAEDGDFAFDPMSLYYGAIGRVGGVGRGLVSPDYVVFRTNDSVDAQFLNALLRFPEMHKVYESLSETGNVFGKRRRLYWSIFEEIDLLLPPLIEQRKIAAILSSVDDAIEATQAVIDQLKVVKKAIMGVLARGLPGRHTRFKTTRIGTVPEEWDVVPLGSVGEWLSGGTPNKGSASLWGGSIPWVSPKDMKRARLADAIDHVTENALGNGTQLAPAGSLLMVVRGMILAHTFPVARAERALAFNQDVKALIPGPTFDSNFLLHWLQGCQPEVLRLVDVANHGTKRLPTERLFAVDVPRPPLDEQREIAIRFDAIDNRYAADTECLAQLKVCRRALMSVLLTGEVRVKPSKDAA